MLKSQFFLFITLFAFISCQQIPKNLNTNNIGKVLESSYSIANISEDERGFNLEIIIKNTPNSIEFNQLIFRKKIAKNLNVKTEKNKTIIETYLPLKSKKIKFYEVEKIEKEDGIIYSINGNTYFYPINFKLKI